MKKLRQTIHELDTKIFEKVGSLFVGFYDQENNVFDFNAIQLKINQYKRYIRYIGYAIVGILAAHFGFILLWGKSYSILFEPIGTLGFAAFIMLLFPVAEYYFKSKIGKLKKVLYLGRIKSHLQEVTQLTNI